MRSYPARTKQEFSREERIEFLRRKVSSRRQAMQNSDSTWMFPLFGLAAGLLVPVSSKSSSRNPLVNILAFVKKTIARMLRLTVVTAILKLFQKPAKRGAKHV